MESFYLNVYVLGFDQKNHHYSHIPVSQGIARGVKISPRLTPPR